MKINEPVRFRVTRLETSIDASQIENFSHFSAVRLARKYYEKNGLSILEGEDFENNLSIYLYDKDKLLRDNYVRVKIGRGILTPQVASYSEQVIAAMKMDLVEKLLCICRFCSYAGSPGFPDLIVGHDLKYVIFDELTTSQKLFLLMSRLLGVEIELVRVSQGADHIDITPGEVFSLILSERRAEAVVNNLNENIEHAKTAADTPQAQDEVDYLVCEKRKISLFLMKDFMQADEISKDELESWIEFVRSNSRNTAFEEFITELENDEEFQSFSGIKTEDAMKKKAEYMQRKFSIGQSRSKLMLNFF